MNRVYRLVFNRQLGVVQVASELGARKRGSSPGGESDERPLHRVVWDWVSGQWLALAPRLEVAARAPLACALARPRALLQLGVFGVAMGVAGIAVADGGRGGDGRDSGRPGGAGGNATTPEGQAGTATDFPLDGNIFRVGGGGGGGASYLSGVNAGRGAQGGAGGGLNQPAAGGAGGDIGAVLESGTNTVVQVGGEGGAGSAPAESVGGDIDGGGGGGGGGGAGLLVTGNGEVVNQANVSGGWGGNGGHANARTTSAGGGGGGGAGGIGVLVTGASSFVNQAGVSITGGSGGKGGNTNSQSGLSGGGIPGIGGDGGAGFVYVGTQAAELLNYGSIVGGLAGSPGWSTQGNFPSGANTSSGAGVVADNLTITNHGVIGGGIGFNFTGEMNFSTHWTKAGVGIQGANLTIVNDGTIRGGLGFANGRANAIVFTGGTNVLELHPGSVIHGRVMGATSPGSSDTLRLAGSGEGSLSLGSGVDGLPFNDFDFFEKTGTSTWTLTSGSSAVTPWEIKEGVLAVNGDAGLGNQAGVLTLNGGALRMLGSSTTSRAINLLAANSIIEVAATRTYTVNGAVYGPGGLVKQGDGTLQLNGAKTYDGATDIQGGTLSVQTPDGLGQSDAAISISNGATLRFSLPSGFISLGSRDIHLGAGGGVLENTANLDIHGAVTGGSLTLRGTGQVTLHAANTYSGGTEIAQGSLMLSDAGTVGSGDVNVASGAWLHVDRPTALTLDNAITGAGSLLQSGSGTLTLTAGNTYSGSTRITSGARLQVGAGGTTGSLGSGLVENQGSLVFNRADEFSVSNVIAYGGSVTKLGAGRLTLAGNSSYAGGTTISEGSVLMTHANALGTGDVFLQPGAELIGTFDGAAGFGALYTQRGSAVRVSAATGTEFGIGRYFLNDGPVITTTGRLSIGSATHAGTVVLGGTGPSAFGQPLRVEVDFGTLKLGSDFSGSLPSGGGTLQVASGAAVDLNGHEARAGQLIGAGSISNSGSADATLRVGADTQRNSIFDGVISDGAHAGVAVQKWGLNTLTLTGENTYTGGTTIHEGTLRVNGSIAGDVQVNTGGTLGGSGSIGNDVTIAAGGTLSAGNSPGTLTIGGDLVLEADSNSIFELGKAGVVGGSSNDLVVVAGNLTLGGRLQATAASAGWYRLFNYGGNLSGQFDVEDVSGSSGFVPYIGVTDTSIDGQVNLMVLAAGQALQHWNGSVDTAGGSEVVGGPGTWSGTGTNWTDASGASAEAWAGSVGVFGGASGGQVDVDGPVYFDTLQFNTDGYVLNGDAGQGDQLRILPASGNAGVINVADGIGAVIAANIVDGLAGSALNKVGSGTLVLSGSNTYSGGTSVLDGTLVAAADDSLGSGAVNIAGADSVVAVEAGIGLHNAFVLADDGMLDNAGTIVTGADGISGQGRLVNRAGGRVEGDVRLADDAASMVTLHAGSVITGDLEIGDHAGSVLELRGTDHGASVRYAFAVQGATGAMSRLVLAGMDSGDAADWTLDRDLEVAHTEIRQGATLRLGGGAENGSVGAGLIENAGLLAIDHDVDRSIDATINGDGRLLKEGRNAALLTAVNGYSGLTEVRNGTLALSGQGSISNSAVYLGVLYGLPNISVQPFAGLSISPMAVAAPLPPAVFDISGADGDRSIVSLAGEADTQVLLGGNTLSFGDEGDHRYDGQISGAGGIVKQGSGRQTLAGYNVYSGKTEIAGGVLALSGAGTVGSGALELSAADTALDIVDADGDRMVGSLSGVADSTILLGSNRLIVFQDEDGEFAGRIEGSGGLTKNANATLGLAGENTYSGMTEVRFGTLALVGAGSISDSGVYLGPYRDLGSISPNATGIQPMAIAPVAAQPGANTPAVFDISAADGDRSVQWLAGEVDTAVELGGNTLAFGDGSDRAYAGVIRGSGGIVKQGSGRQVLAGANTFTGDTRIAAGTLALAGAGALGGGDLQVGSGATFEIADADGDRAIGNLEGADGSRIVLGDNALSVNQVVDGSFAGVIEGNGDLAKAGTGTLALGGANSFTGELLVNAGTLLLGGSVAGNAVVGSGAVLAGTGRVGGNVQVGSGGILSPGNSPGVMTIDGNLGFADGGIYEVELGANTWDKVMVGGRASLAGGILRVTALDAATDYRRGDVFTILESAGGVEGRFGQFVNQSAFLQLTEEYLANAVNLLYVVRDPFSSAAGTPNQIETAGALDSLGDSAGELALYNSLLLLDQTQARAAFDSLSGQVHASARSALLDNRFLQEGIEQRLHGNVWGSSGERGSLWLSAGVGNQRVASDGNGARNSTSGEGLRAGADLQVSEGFLLGVAAGSQRLEHGVYFNAERADIDEEVWGVYAQGQRSGWTLAANVSRSDYRIDTRRQTAIAGGEGQLLQARRNAKATTAELEVAHTWSGEKASWQPYLRLARTRLEADALNEAGGSHALGVDAADTDRSTATLGLRGGWQSTPKLAIQYGLGWQRARGDLSVGSVQRFVVGGDDFTILAAVPEGTGVVGELGATLRVGERSSLSWGMLGRRAGNHSDLAGNFTLRIGF